VKTIGVSIGGFLERVWMLVVFDSTKM